MSQFESMAEKRAHELSVECRKLQDELEAAKKELEKEKEEHRGTRSKLSRYIAENEAFRFCISNIFGGTGG